MLATNIRASDAIWCQGFPNSVESKGVSKTKEKNWLDALDD